VGDRPRRGAAVEGRDPRVIERLESPPQRLVMELRRGKRRGAESCGGCMLENLGDEVAALVHTAEAMAHHRLHHVPGRDDLPCRVWRGGLVEDVAKAACCKHPRDEAEVISDVPARGLFPALSSPQEILPTRNMTQMHRGPAECRFDRRNRPYMHDDAYLAQGGPMGVGVIEGACRHLVKDRMEPSGMRWTKTGAQAVLDLRAVRLNGQWEAYGQCHRHQHHRRVYGTSAHVPERAEAQALTSAA